MAKHDEILKFWFDQITPTSHYFNERNELWFGGAPETDSRIRTEFEKEVQLAETGQLNAWEQDPRSCLALIILLDQFSMNMYRNLPQSFLNSEKAIPVATKAMSLKFDQNVHPVERAFYYMPLMHAEDLSLQKRSVEVFGRLADTSPHEFQPLLNSFKEFAVFHLEPVKKFGRFPDRNEILGRAHTPEEAEYMRHGGPPF